MTELSKIILEKYQIRKSKKQKRRFEQLLKDNGVDFSVEEGGFLKSRNIIVGNPKTAKVLLTAHYDTCAALPVPNLIFPKNIILTLLYGVLIAIPFLLGMDLGISAFGHLFRIGAINKFWMLSLILLNNLFWIFLMFFMFMGPIANKHTANDNTSGVITLCELMHRMDEKTKKQTAFIFFDNEENGLLGSGFYRKRHKGETLNQLIINFDCVSDGDNFLIVYNKGAAKFLDKLKPIEKDGKKVLIEKSLRAFYPSDQMGFKNAVAVAALWESPLGLYIGRIHTNRDTVFDESNIEYICEQFKDIVAKLVSE